LERDLGLRIAECRRIAAYNQRWDIAFKVLLLVLTLGATVCSVFIANYTEKPPAALAIASAILAGASTALSAFAFSQFNFAARQTNWSAKANAYDALRVELLYAEPDKITFVQRMNQLLRIDDNTSAEPATANAKS